MNVLLCFDLDDTLLDHRSAERAAATSFAERFSHRVPVTGEAFAVRWHEATERHFQAFLRGECSFRAQRRRRIGELVGETLPDDEADSLFDAYLEAYEANWRLFDDVLPCLGALSGIQLGVITNAAQAQQEAKLEHLGSARHFSFVLSAEKAGCAKPDPAIFQQASAFAGEPRTCIYVGDSLTLDAEAATAAGWHGIWLNRRGEAVDCSPAMLRTFEDLPAYLLSVVTEAKV